jgi:hypothetical protein
MAFRTFFPDLREINPTVMAPSVMPRASARGRELVLFEGSMVLSLKKG